jgi:hypothetical protein
MFYTWRMKQILFAIALAASPACLVSGGVRGGFVAQPELVVVSPGVQVVADYDEPIFYSDGLYWRFTGGAWYSSRVHTGGWYVNSRVPMGVRGISRPEAYVHYRAGGAVRDHREPGWERREERREAQPIVRDHREERREERHEEHREEVRDHREERHEERREHKDDKVRDHRH